MQLKGEDADTLLKLMDGGVPEYHMQWRKKTHNEKAALKIALAVAISSDSPIDEVFLKALMDAQRHIIDDETFNKLIYGKKPDKEEIEKKDDDRDLLKALLR